VLELCQAGGGRGGLIGQQAVEILVFFVELGRSAALQRQEDEPFIAHLPAASGLKRLFLNDHRNVLDSQQTPSPLVAGALPSNPRAHRIPERSSRKPVAEAPSSLGNPSDYFPQMIRPMGRLEEGRLRPAVDPPPVR
jgi:hypothetical protein